MCYDVEQQKWRVVQHLKRFGTEEEYRHAYEDYQRKWKGINDEPGFHLSGFSHPELLIVKSLGPLQIDLAKWGLIPAWAKDEALAFKLWNQTINARGETVFEKPAFRKAAAEGRCLIIVNSFFEHHHLKKQVFPYRIKYKKDEPIILAGICDTWVNRDSGELIQTASIVTTTANPLMAKIHNNPKVPVPRMPLILNDDEARSWLSRSDQETLQTLIRPSDETQLEVYTVQKLRGKDALGDVPESIEPYEYAQLTSTPKLDL